MHVKTRLGDQSSKVLQHLVNADELEKSENSSGLIDLNAFGIDAD